MLVRGRLLAPEDRGHVVVALDGDRVGSITPVPADSVAPEGALGGPTATITPGLIDLQVNGAFGHDFSDPRADVAWVSAGLPEFGVTGYLATVVTSPLPRYDACLANLGRAMAADVAGARLLGVHMEGPFLNIERRGTHTPEWLQPVSAELAEGWLASGAVRLMTLAPELPGAVDLTRRLVAGGVTVSMGHTDATYAQAAAAADAGARLGTHLFNAMRPLHHREPGVVGFLLDSDLSASVVADGVHVHPRMLALVARLKAPDQLVVVTDALAGLGMEGDRFQLSGVEIVADGAVGRRLDGTISGSLAPLPQALRLLIGAGVRAEDAIRAATVNPARTLGREDELGQLAPGRTADISVFGPEWDVLATLVDGQVRYRAQDAGDRHAMSAGHGTIERR